LQRIGRLIFIVFLFCSLLIFLSWKQILQHVAADKRETISAAVQRNSNLAVSLEQYTIRTIHNADALLQLVKIGYEGQGDEFDLPTFLDKGVIDVQHFSDVSILDEKGRIVKSNINAPSLSVHDFAGRGTFNYHRTRKDQLYIGRPTLSKTIGKAVIVLSRRIDKADGSFGGIVAVRVEPSTFMQFYANANLRAHDIISLIAPNGITYARRTGNKESHGENISRSPLFQHVVKKTVGHYLAKDAIRGIQTYFSYRKLVDYPIIATVGSAEEEILAEYHERTKREYVFGGVFTVSIVLFSVFVCYGYIERRKKTRLLQDSETRYRSIVENSHDAIIVAQANGVIEAMNQAACQLFIVENERLHTLTLEHLFRNSEPKITIQHGALKGVASKQEVFFTRDDSTTFTGEIVCSDYVDGEGDQRFIVLVRDISLRKQMQEQLLNEQKKYERKLTKQIIYAQERERETIGYELHDNVNQILTTVKLYLEMAIHKPEMKNELLPKAIEYVLTCISEIRNLSRKLSAPTLGTQSLIDSIKGLIDMVAYSSKLSVDFVYNGYHTTLVKDQRLAIYRILQEVLNNIIKHAEATKVQIDLLQAEGMTFLTITDNGKGFDPSMKLNGIGLNNIQSRTKVFGGDVIINSKKGKGCCITVKLPIISDKSMAHSDLIQR
jgi:PAS domain S-box-containing protein